MSEKKFKYRVEVNTADVARAAAEVRLAFSGATNQVEIGGPVLRAAEARAAAVGGRTLASALGLAAVGAAAVVQVGMMTWQLAQLGAANARTEKSFEGLAQSANMASDALLGRLRTATQGMITDQKLMAQTNSLMVAAQTQGIAVTEKQIETLGKFARLRAEQLNVPTEDVFSRLMAGVGSREVEVLRELGMSGQAMADALDVPMREINKSADGFLRGVVAVAEQQIAKFAEPTVDAMGQVEQATIRMKNAWDDLAIAATEPVAFVVTWTAERTEGIAATLEAGIDSLKREMGTAGASSIEQVISTARERMRKEQDDVVRQARENPQAAPVTDAQVEAFQKKREAVERYESALDSLEQAEEAAKSRIYAPAGSSKIFADSIGSMEEGNAALNDLNQTVNEAAAAYVRLAQLEQAGMVDPATLGQADSAWQTIVAGIDDGSLSLADANGLLSKMLGLLSQISPMIGPQLQGVAAAVTQWAPGVMNFAAQSRVNAVVAGKIAPEDLNETERPYRLAVGDLTEQAAIHAVILEEMNITDEGYLKQRARLDGVLEQIATQEERTAQEIRDKATGLRSARLGLNMAQTDAGGQIALLQSFGQTLAAGSVEDLNNRAQIAGLERRAIEDSRQEWKRTAQEVERNFEAAADKIMSIPGVTSLTPVTGQQMLDTRYGVYENQPDEWVRRVRDELTDSIRNTQTDEYGNVTESFTPRKTRDYADVSREQVERLTGMAAGTPSDVMIPRLERKWESGSLFADPANLSLMNMDAIRGQVEEMKAGQTGRANQQKYIMDSLGISQADAALITGQQAPLVQMLTGGQSNEEIAGQLSGVGEAVNKTLLAPWAVATGPSPLVSMFTGGLSNEDIVGQMDMEGLGRTIAERVLAPLQSGGMVRALSDGWAVDVRDNIKLMYGPIDSLAGAVNERLDKKIGVGLKIVDIVVARVLEEIAADL